MRIGNVSGRPVTGLSPSLVASPPAIPTGSPLTYSTQGERAGLARSGTRGPKTTRLATSTAVHARPELVSGDTTDTLTRIAAGVADADNCPLDSSGSSELAMVEDRTIGRSRMSSRRVP